MAMFNQSGGTNITNSLNVGFFIIPNVDVDGDDGSYNLSGGSLSAGEENIGYMGPIHNTSDHIVFAQTGGANLTAQLNIAGVGQFDLAGGTLQIASSLLNDGIFDLQNPAAAGLTGTNTLTLAPLPITGTGTIEVEQNAALYATSITQGSLIIGGKIQIAPGSATSVINSLNITTGTLDITNNALIIDYPAAGPSPLSTVRSYIYSGYASNWGGPGIVSSTAAGDMAVGVGYAEASALGITTFGGVAVDSTAILIRYTWMGDANLDGIVNAADLAMISSNGSTWSTGDFNYDGVVNADDYALFDLGLAEGGSTVIPFPEPTWLGCLLVPFLRRRREYISIGPEIT
jgi:hypothetical protein